MNDERSHATEWALLDRYLAGQCSLDEQTAMEAWLARTPEAQAIVDELRSVTLFPEGDRIPFDLKALEARLLSQIGGSAEALPLKGGSLSAEIGHTPSTRFPRSLHESMQSRSPQKMGTRYPLARIGLVGFVCLLVATVIWGPRTLSRLNSAPVQQSFSTVRGQQTEFTLEDGTRVWLAPETQLRYTGGTGSSERIVELTGEAIFTVSHNDRSPFLVKAGNTTTRVLETTFGVRLYPEDSAVRVAIQDGKVAVGHHVLTPGDVLLANRAGNDATVLRGQSISSLFGWRSGKLVFNNARMDEILPVLSRWYDIEFVLADPRLAERRVTVPFDQAQLTTEVLDLLSTTLRARYLRIGRTITFYPQVP